MDRTQIKFLLDENIPAKIKRSFTVRGLKCQMIQDLG
ncbi:MAG: hypothetical protein RBG13Loki_3962 [Promethearchaeota archaeon CR_4]|nr:MAG: hypothetical protein RBG13Loki_3962 [Candidatus Lokiarchaeota archaeon CR_4]